MCVCRIIHVYVPTDLTSHSQSHTYVAIATHKTQYMYIVDLFL